MNRFSRRDLFRLTGSLAVGAALRSFRAEAQAAAIPKRILLFFTPHGTVWNSWRPTGLGKSMDLSKSYILKSINDAKLASKVNVLEGVGLPVGGPGAPHTRGPAVLFTGSGLADDGTFQRSDCSGGCSFGWNTSLSVDQEIANRLGTVTPYKSLQFGVDSGGGFPGAFISYAGPAQPNTPMQDPYVAFNQLFAGLSASAPDKAKQLARRQGVISAIQADLNALNGRVSRADWMRLQAQQDAIASIQQSLQVAAASCTVPKTPAHLQTSDPTWRQVTVDRHSELAAASLACGLTRVASIQYRPGENDGGPDGIYSWVHPTPTSAAFQSAEHHLQTHDGSATGQQAITEIYRWYAQRFTYLLQQLDSYPEADGGTLLDHTLVVWGSEIGEGVTHDIKNVPFVLAGGGKAGMVTGQYLKMPGTMNHRLLVTMLHYMGYTSVQKFGSLDTGSGVIPGLLG